MRYGTGPLAHTPTVVKNLVIINVIVYGVKFIGQGRFLGMDMDATLGLHYITSPNSGLGSSSRTCSCTVVSGTCS